jgi:hypothetical protein
VLGLGPAGPDAAAGWPEPPAWERIEPLIGLG